MTPIALSHGGTTTYASVAPARRLLVGTADGVIVLDRSDGRDDWSVTQPGLVGSHVRALPPPAPPPRRGGGRCGWRRGPAPGKTSHKLSALEGDFPFRVVHPAGSRGL